MDWIASAKNILAIVKLRLSRLSFRTGIFVLAACAVFYGLSFASLLLPVDYAVKGALWAVFFGLAKTAQYSALLILGKEGLKKIKASLSRRKAKA